MNQARCHTTKRSVREVADRCLGLLRDRDNFCSRDRRNESRCFLWVENFDLLSRALEPLGQDGSGHP